MNKKQPNRLTNEQYLSDSAPIHIYRQAVDERFELHWHEFYELCFILSGTGTNVVNGVKHPLQSGSVFLLTPADFHEIYPDEGHTLDLFNIVFTESCVDEPLYKLLFRELTGLSALFEGEASLRLETEFRRIWKESAELRPGHEIIVKGSFERILVEIVRRRQEDAALSPSRESIGGGMALQQPDVYKALVYMHHHFRGAITLDDASRQARLVPNYFSECFRKMTGIPFQQYLLDLRLKFAKSLLAASGLPVTEVCHASGFNTLTHFERSFKQKFGQSPRYYRKK